MNTVRKLQLKAARLPMSFLLAMLTLAILAQAAMGQPVRSAPAASLTPPAATITLTEGGQTVATFKSVSGLNNLATELEAARGEVKRTPGRLQPGRITLSGGDARDAQYLYKWHQQTLQGNVAAARRDVALVLHSADGKQLARYELKRAWPARLAMTAVRAGAGSAPVETLELEFESISRIE